MNVSKHFVYFLRSLVNGKVYVGSNGKDPMIRLKEHNSAANSWTRVNKPFILLFFEEYTCSRCAKMREKFYKTGIGRQIKSAIIESMEKTKNVMPG